MLRKRKRRAATTRRPSRFAGTSQVKAFDHLMKTLTDAANNDPEVNPDVLVTPLTPDDAWAHFFPHLNDQDGPQNGTGTSIKDSDPKALATIFYQENAGDGTTFDYPVSSHAKASFARPARLILDCLQRRGTPINRVLSNEGHFAKYFNRTCYDTYRDLLDDDFRDRDNHNEMMVFDEVAKPYVPNLIDSQGFNRNEAYIARLVNVTMYVLAAFYGPRDYRMDILSAVRGDDPVGRAHNPHREVNRNYLTTTSVVKQLSCQYLLARVTYATDKPDALDYVECWDVDPFWTSRPATPVAYDLSNVTDVSFGHYKLHRTDRRRLMVPVESRQPLGTEYVHLTLSGQGWVIEDKGSDGGTMVCRRNGDRFFLYKDHETDPNEPLPLKNGDVICLSPDWATGYPRPNGQNYVISSVTTFWDVP